ncbi:MAG: YjgN family protein [Granulosicoccus sp.]
MEAGSRGGNRYPFSFTGKGGEYFKIWIVNIILTILTLYIYSAWAKVRNKRYFHGNTILDGSGFDYHAKPLQILLSRLVAAALLIAVTLGSYLHALIPLISTIVLVVIVPWALWRSIKFNARMTSYRNVRFGFNGPLKWMYIFQFLLPLLPIALFGGAGAFVLATSDDSMNELGGALIAVGVFVSILLAPWIQKLMSSYILNHYQYGKSQFSATLSTGRFYAILILAVLLGLLSLIIVGAVIVVIGYLSGLISMDVIEVLGSDKPEDALSGVFVLGIVAFYVAMFTIGFFFTAYVRARLRMHTFSRALLDRRVSFESTVTSRGLWWVLFSNFLITVFTLGLGIPFAKVRLARYLANNTVAYAEEPLDQFVGEKREEVGAFGDELGDAFDMDMDVGF